MQRLLRHVFEDLAKALLQVMGGQDIQDLENMSAIWMQNLESFVRKMNNTKSLMIGMKPKDTINDTDLDLVKAEGYLK